MTRTTTAPPITTNDRATDLSDVGDEPTRLRNGLPYRDGDLDIPGLGINMYDVDIHTDIARLNEAGMRTRTFFFRHVTESERVRLWGRIIAARPFNRKSHYHLWGDHTDIDGISEAPNFQKYMPHWHLKHNCAKVKYNKTTPGACPNTWAMFNPLIVADIMQMMLMLMKCGPPWMKQ